MNVEREVKSEVDGLINPISEDIDGYSTEIKKLNKQL